MIFKKSDNTDSQEPDAPEVIHAIYGLGGYEIDSLINQIRAAEFDADNNDGKIHSRIGLTADAHSVDSDFNFFNFVAAEKIKKSISCILIDEVQFLTKEQVRQVCKVSDELNIPAMCYGIRTDFQGKLFEGSLELLDLADNLIELKTVCDCGRKAIMVVRLDEKGKVVKDGDQIKIGGNDSYKVFCRKHFRELTHLI